jgi:hypothetical protein
MRAGRLRLPIFGIDPGRAPIPRFSSRPRLAIVLAGSWIIGTSSTTVAAVIVARSTLAVILALRPPGAPN